MAEFSVMRLVFPNGHNQDIAFVFHQDSVAVNPTINPVPISLHLGAGNRSWRSDKWIGSNSTYDLPTRPSRVVPSNAENTALFQRPESLGDSIQPVKPEPKEFSAYFLSFLALLPRPLVRIYTNDRRDAAIRLLRPIVGIGVSASLAAIFIFEFIWLCLVLLPYFTTGNGNPRLL
ncbi:hypothetical protein F5B20DRAFT_425374 [Whalleya microplaca]|nr:hypothetical protein F5B20DRAFT_425374 [Whalleya microplaca]